MPTDPDDPHPTTADRHLTRASLFDRLRDGTGPARELAWGEFHARYAPVVAGFARRCGAGAQDVDDIVQDVIAAFFAVSGEFAYDPARGRFRGWLKTCAVRCAIRRAGKNLRFRGVPLDQVSGVELAVEPLWNDVWEQALVAQALALIREECRDGIAFRAFERYVLLDQPAERVAAELGVSVDVVYQSKTRITRQLREAVRRVRAADD